MVCPARAEFHALLGFLAFPIEVLDGLLKRRLGSAWSAPVCQFDIGGMRLGVDSMGEQQRGEVLGFKVSSEELVESILWEDE